MADVHCNYSRNSKTRARSKSRFDDNRENAFARKYDDESDRHCESASWKRDHSPKKHDFSIHSRSESTRKESFTECKRKSYDRNVEERRIHFSRQTEDRKVLYRSDENNEHNTSAFYHSTSHEKTNDNYRRCSIKDESFKNKNSNDNEEHRQSYESNRYSEREQRDERFVSYNHNNPTASKDDEFIASLWQKIDFLSNKVELLNQENEKLRTDLSCISNDHYKANADVFIMFQNKSFEERFLPTLLELVSNLIRGDLTVEVLQELHFLKVNSEKEIIEDNLFTLDNSVAELDETSSVPKYDTSFSETLQKEDLTKVTKKVPGRIPKNCFNCSEDHDMRDCPVRLNHRKVAQARRMFKPFAAKTVRYHVQNVRESTLKPGIISEELRDALDLRPDQIPLHIYNMRILNYPPGWLEEAEVKSSGIMLYGIDGTATKKESGKTEEADSQLEVQIDSDKLIDFPGFNIPLPPNVIDECFTLGFPPLQEHLLRSVVEQKMPKSKLLTNRKRKLDLPTNQPLKMQRLEEDMEIEDSDTETLEFIPPLPEDSLPPPPPEKDWDSHSGTNTPTSASMLEALAPVVERFKLNQDPTGNSLPSLKELEEMKKRLVMELGSASLCSTPDSFDNDSLNAGDDVVIINSGVDNNDLSSFSDCSFGSNPINTPRFPYSVQRTEIQISKSKLVTLGTPSLAVHSSYQKLPDYDNFSKNVTSHLNFENLPSSTGSYERMKGVLKKVKTKINSFLH